jgi:hypothetical protein
MHVNAENGGFVLFHKAMAKHCVCDVLLKNEKLQHYSFEYKSTLGPALPRLTNDVFNQQLFSVINKAIVYLIGVLINTKLSVADSSWIRINAVSRGQI